MEIVKGQTIAVVFGEPAGLVEPPFEAEPTLGPRGLGSCRPVRRETLRWTSCINR
jgi:hypothetical protein